MAINGSLSTPDLVVGPRPAPESAGARTRAPESWWGEARAVFVKDVRSELRTRAAVATILLFAVVTLLILALMVPADGPGFKLHGGDLPIRRPAAAAGRRPREAFSARPDCRVRSASSASTSAKVIPRACSTTRR